ncbi:MAG: SUMF1/EgtB/PvdO family nonheme iron enzyme [Spirochaetes bacterium]|nr:SUMF1/EgtB/PvdO family nonheme iron enzyme [Spirochaetota bacterium]
MKRIVLMIAACICFASGCDENEKTTILPVGGGSGLQAGDTSFYNGDNGSGYYGVGFTMVYVPAKTFRINSGSEVDSGTAKVSRPFWIGETEVTYILWHRVRAWAVSHGYFFVNYGTEGDDGTPGDDPSTTSIEPVTTVNWRDAMVWTNAATEWYNEMNGASLTCVYYSDSGYTTPLRDTADGVYGSTVNSEAGSFDNPHVRPRATGFRLLTSDEWELAARYIDDANNDGDISDPGEYYPGDYASGATANGQYLWATNFVAWYDANSSTNHTKDVKTKEPNALGLYDMSGNVWEWCFDWYNATSRTRRGGCYAAGYTYLEVGNDLYSHTPYSEAGTIGFRIAKSQ